MTETQRLVWLMAHPVCSEVNNAVQQLTGVQYNTSEQHKDLTAARQGKDMAGRVNYCITVFRISKPIQ